MGQGVTRVDERNGAGPRSCKGLRSATEGEPRILKEWSVSKGVTRVEKRNGARAKVPKVEKRSGAWVKELSGLRSVMERGAKELQG